TSKSISALTLGSHTIIVSYSGDTDFVASSGNKTQVVNQAPTATGLAANLTPSVVGQGVTFTATISATGGGSGTPTGSVSFYDNSVAPANLLDTQTLAGGAATSKSVTSLSLGAHTIVAAYAGDANYVTSTGNVAQVVNQASTTSTLASNLTP